MTNTSKITLNSQQLQVSCKKRIVNYQKCIVKEAETNNPNIYVLNKYSQKIQELHKQLLQEQKS